MLKIIKNDIIDIYTKLTNAILAITDNTIKDNSLLEIFILLAFYSIICYFGIIILTLLAAFITLLLKSTFYIPLVIFIILYIVITYRRGYKFSNK